MIPLSKPDITEFDRQNVSEVLNTSQVSYGNKSVVFSQLIADYVGVKYCVLTNSGTSALHLIMKALNIGQDDEVITTPFSFVASSNCILYVGAKPVFVDIDDNFNIDINKIYFAITNKTKAILAVDVFGLPCDWKGLGYLAKTYELKLVEDSCEALGAEYYTKKCGSFGDAGCFGFYANKPITTSEGGCITTNNKELADLCSSMVNQGRNETNNWFEHDRLGYNYRLGEVNCALGIGQMQRITEIMDKRAKVAELYNERLSFVSGINLCHPHNLNYKRGWFVYVITLDEKLSQYRDLIVQQMSEVGIECGKYFAPIHLQKFYRDSFGYKDGDFPITERIAKSTIALPFFNNLQEKEIDYITDNIRRIVGRLYV